MVPVRHFSANDISLPLYQPALAIRVLSVSGLKSLVLLRSSYILLLAEYVTRETAFSISHLFIIQV